MFVTDDPAALDKLRVRIQALCAKTVENGCTEDEAMAAAAKVAELLDRHDLSSSDVALRASSCERAVYETHRNKRLPIGDCIGAVADFCDCAVWRERDAGGGVRHVFFGLPADAAAALVLIRMVEEAVRGELGRYKIGRDYQRLRHQDRHLANASFALGMVASIAERIDAMKAERERVAARTGRDLVILKTSAVEAELQRLGIAFTTSRRASRMVAPDAYAAGKRVGTRFTVAPGARPAR